MKLGKDLDRHQWSAGRADSQLCLLTIQDLVHEGMPLLEGKKEIVSLNIWASRYLKQVKV